MFRGWGNKRREIVRLNIRAISLPINHYKSCKRQLHEWYILGSPFHNSIAQPKRFVVKRACLWPIGNDRNFHPSRQPTMQMQPIKNPLQLQKSRRAPPASQFMNSLYKSCKNMVATVKTPVQFGHSNLCLDSNEFTHWNVIIIVIITNKVKSVFANFIMSI